MQMGRDSSFLRPSLSSDDDDLNKSLAEPGISCIYTTPTSSVDFSPPLVASLLLDRVASLDGIAFDILLVEDNRINRAIVG
jgi:hypothetical protein